MRVYPIRSLSPSSVCRVASGVVGCLVMGLSTAVADGLERTQVVELEAGWNAVYLEVEPEEAAPEAVFEGMPVDVVAQYFQRQSPVQFIANPEEVDFHKPE